MTLKSAAPAGSSELGLARDRERTTFGAIRVLAVAAIAFVVITSFQARPAPGGNGEALGASLALLAFCSATIAAVWLARAGTPVQLVLLLIAVGSSAALIGLQANHAALLGVFPAVCMGALALPTRVSAPLCAVAAIAVSGAWLAIGHSPVAGIILNDFGIVAFYVLSLFARRLRESNQLTGQLLAELEQTRAAQAQAAVLAERQRLAREMHDVLAHALSGLVLNLESAKLVAAHTAADPQVGSAIERAHGLAKTGLEEARRAIGTLHQDALPGPERLADLAAAFEADTGVACMVTTTGSSGRDLGTDSRLTIYRVTQEALTNIRKHACPDRVEICLAYQPSGVSLTIEDFGSGGERKPPVAANGYGLSGMTERAELLGGTLTAGATTRGFRVELRVPA